MNESNVRTGSSPGHQPEPNRTGRSRFGIAAVVAVVAIPLVVLAALGSRGNASDPSSEPVVGDGVATSSTATTTPGSDTSATTVDSTVPLEPAVAVLGVDTGLEIWVGGDSRISRIELDTGRRFQIEIRGYPLVVSGPWLIAYEPLSESFRRIDRREPAQPLETLDAGDDFTITAIAESPIDSSVWVADSTGDKVAWRMLSLATGAPLRTTVTDAITLIAIADAADLALGPETDVRQIGADSATEVWRLNGQTHELWFSGSIIARDAQVALVENCDITCTIEWRNIETGDLLDRPVPPNLLDLNELLGDATWIYSRSEDITASLVINATSFAEVDTKTRRRTRPFDIDESGTWAAMTGSQRVFIIDLATGNETPVPGGRSLVGSTASVVFAPAI